MEIEIDTKSPEPVYAQIVRQIREAVQRGMLQAGHSLPPVRQLAGDLMINPNTVAKAYKQLEGERVIRGAGRQGTFVEENAKAQIELSNNQDAQHELDNLLRDLERRGMTRAQIKIILFDQIERLEKIEEAKKKEQSDDKQISFAGLLGRT